MTKWNHGSMTFSRYRRRWVRADFSGGSLLLREIDRRLGLTARVARRLGDARPRGGTRGVAGIGRSTGASATGWGYIVGTGYIVGLARSQVLERETAAAYEVAGSGFEATGRKSRSFTELHYAARIWRCPGGSSPASNTDRRDATHVSS